MDSYERKQIEQAVKKHGDSEYNMKVKIYYEGGDTNCLSLTPKQALQMADILDENCML